MGMGMGEEFEKVRKLREMLLRRGRYDVSIEESDNINVDAILRDIAPAGSREKYRILPAHRTKACKMIAVDSETRTLLHMCEFLIREKYDGVIPRLNLRGYKYNIVKAGLLLLYAYLRGYIPTSIVDPALRAVMRELKHGEDSDGEDGNVVM